jgi:predicted RNA-binding protein with PIN domain
LQKSLLDYISSDTDFRDSLAERFGAKPFDDPIAEAFLTDPAQAEMLIAAQLESDRVDRLTLELNAAAAAVLDLEAKLATAKERIETLRTQNEIDLAEQAASARRARQGLERQLADAVEEAARLRTERDELEGTVAGVSETVTELRGRLSRREERADRRSLGATDGMGRGRAESLPTDPVELAASLDDLERRLHFYRESIGSSTEVRPVRVSISLPHGVSPESADALDALLEQAPDTVLVDGYNVAGVVSETLIGSRLGRDDVVARAEACKRRSPDTEVIVIFDASGSGGRGGFRSRGGVLVEFEPDTTADDAIVDLVHTAADQCVVITNDRELQDRSARQGCVVVFSSALISWTEHLNGKAN